MTLHIRAYSPADRDFVLSLVSRFSEFDLPDWRTKAEIDATNQHALQEALQKTLDAPEPGAAILIAEDESGAQAGFIHLQTQVDYFNGELTGYISDLAVAPAFEGQGAGRLLLDAAEAWARAQGYHLLTLYVFAGNTHARQIYEKRGFGQEVIKYARKL